ncbi:MAG TPA: serine hydrolase domain-containing protein, partial [Gemmatimonadaceae bacterium]|nr:serine hydrolase domain-containing protein [Gemmatimonadaceae bacterium]
MILKGAVAATLVLATVGAAQSPETKAQELDAYVAQAVRDWQSPGLAIAVVKDGKLVFAKGYGVREIGKPAPFDTATMSAIASTTKAITAAAIGMLVDEGKVNWDDPVTKYLPSFELYDPFVT